MATAGVTAERVSSAWKQRLRRRLLAWYAKHARDLPWRRSRDPYLVWVSEIMLQQTQVATVGPYFERFIRAFPTVERLARADERQVLRLWEGLGYYRRARQLHAAAREIVAEHRGEIPREVDQLRKLPGIGRYTAGAIASIAFDDRAPILEANSIRLLARLVGYRGDVTKAPGQRALWRTAEEVLPRQNVARFNQALMELGSLVCTPTEPNCRACPLISLCKAHRLNLVRKIPRPKARTKFTALREAAVVVRRNGRVLVRQCAEGERWAGLWDFPRFSLEADSPLLVRKEIIKKVRGLTGVTCAGGELVKTIKHGVTRYRITLECYSADYRSGRVRSSRSAPVRWAAVNELADYPLSTTGRKIARIVAAK